MPQQLTPIQPTKRFQCRHLRPSGHRCGSPALRGEPFCYYHHTTRRPAPHPSIQTVNETTPETVQDHSGPGTPSPRTVVFDLPLPEDRASVQLAIGEVLRRIARNEIDPRRAGLLLYGLQTASANLPRTPKPEAATDPVDEIVQNPELGDLAPEAELGNTGERFSFARMLWDDLQRNPPAPRPAPDPTPWWEKPKPSPAPLNAPPGPATPDPIPDLIPDPIPDPTQVDSPTLNPDRPTSETLPSIQAAATHPHAIPCGHAAAASRDQTHRTRCRDRQPTAQRIRRRPARSAPASPVPTITHVPGSGVNAVAPASAICPDPPA